MAEDKDTVEKRSFFWAIYFVATLSGVFMIVSISDWAILYKRADFNESKVVIIEIEKNELRYPAFGYHPLLMTVGMIFLLGQSSVLFVLFPDLPVARTKIYHLVCMSVTVAITFFGLNAVFATSTSHMGNPHDCVGIATAILFCFQFLAGFIIKFYPGGPKELVKRYKNFHNFFGILVFMFSFAAATSGVSRVSDTQVSHHGLGRLYIVCLMMYVGLILLLLAFPNFQPRKQLAAKNSPPAETGAGDNAQSTETESVGAHSEGSHYTSASQTPEPMTVETTDED